MMKSIFLAVAVLVSVALADQINSDWQQWKIIHKRSYSIAEDNLRRQIFKANAERIASHNRLFDLGLKSYRLGVNRFSDMTSTERAQKFLGAKLPQTHGIGSKTHTSSGNNPASIDWRDHSPKIVSEVKDQGSCGSCWAFSTTGSVEGQHALATGKLVSLSEQQLVDCSNVSPYDNGGCMGGFMNVSFQYIQDIGGIESEDEYPYEGVDGECRFDKTKVKATVTGYVNVKKGSEEDLQNAVATVGPISVAIEVEDSFFEYTGGVYDGADCLNEEDALNHGVLVVGYGTENGKDYYIVKNSWNGQWGEAGYVKMIRNTGGQCGITLAASYPTVK